MGLNTSKKLAAKCTFLSKEEQVIVGNCFRLTSRNSDRIKEEELKKVWGSQIDARLLQYINNYLFSKGDAKSATVDLERFAELYVYCIRGTVDEKLKILLCSIGPPPENEAGSSAAPKEPSSAHATDPEHLAENAPHVLVKEVRTYIESVVASYMKIQKLTNSKQFKTWHSRGCYIHPQNIQRVAESLIYELATTGDQTTRRALELWLQGSTVLGQLLIYVFNHLYGISHRDMILQPEVINEKCSVDHYVSAEPISPDDKERSLVPYCRGLDLIPSYPSHLDLPQLLFINANLPQQYQREWRFLFSSEIHGESFATLIGRIANQGPCVIVIEDSSGYTFGGFAPSNWELGPNFFGDDSCFLFSLAPKMRVYPSTGYNQHFQYLNLHQQTMPNGLGMGGQHGYCGLWLDDDYGSGHTSETCTTFKGYSQMSQEKVFKYRHLEVWGLGQPPQTPQERGERIFVAPGMAGSSVLDGNAEGKAMLKMVGRTMHSEGLKEPPRD